jgi:uncharacterized OB-fold protein
MNMVNMKDLVDKFSWAAMSRDANSTFAEYLRLLVEESRLCSTRCDGCGYVTFPARPFCPKCWATDVSWIDIHENATLYAFTTQNRSIRFMAPDVIGLVELPALTGNGRILTKIEGTIGDLTIGQPLTFEPFQISKKIWTHSFKA